MREREREEKRTRGGEEKTEAWPWHGVDRLVNGGGCRLPGGARDRAPLELERSIWETALELRLTDSRAEARRNLRTVLTR